MAKITALRENKRRSRTSIFLDGRFAFSVSAGVAAREGLECDQVLTDDRLDALAKSDRYERCLRVALNLLSYRPRSVTEVRGKLRDRGFDPQTLDLVLEALKARRLLDDSAFAEFWTGNRQAFSPRSRRMVRSELQKKGVAGETAAQAVESIDDERGAYQAAVDRVKSFRWSDRDQFRRRLGGYLQRRGFGYSVIGPALERVWKEVQTETHACSDSTLDID
jgi:regulatory protein